MNRPWGEDQREAAALLGACAVALVVLLVLLAGCAGAPKPQAAAYGPVASYERRLVTHGTCYADCMWLCWWDTSKREPLSLEGSACQLGCRR